MMKFEIEYCEKSVTSSVFGFCGLSRFCCHNKLIEISSKFPPINVKASNRTFTGEKNVKYAKKCSLNVTFSKQICKNRILSSLARSRFLCKNPNRQNSSESSFTKAKFLIKRLAGKNACLGTVMSLIIELMHFKNTLWQFRTSNF